MDESEDGVTLYSGFVCDILAEYESMRHLCAPAFELAKGLDPARPTEKIPISVYNQICRWIERNLGAASIREAGRAIGERVYQQMRRTGGIDQNAGPVDVLRALKVVADMMVQDPKGRGWVVLEADGRSCRMRRTQSFNCTLQEGLLTSLVARTPVISVEVEHDRCTRRGDPYCEYEIRWIARRPSGGHSASPRQS